MKREIGFIYLTDDGKAFADLNEAKKHEKRLNRKKRKTVAATQK